MVQAGWDDAPHLTEAAKADLLAGTPPHLREARSQGTPALGSGAIYPIPTTEVTCAPFAIPAHWPRGYALDVGWRRTAAIWGAWDREAGTVYLYSEYYAAKQPPSIHAAAIKTRGAWINGCIDPAAQGGGQRDGLRLIDDYTGAGLRVIPADNAVEAGLDLVWEMLATGRLKAFLTLGNWQAEYRLYRRDDAGRVVKENDHLMDAMRYICLNYKKYFSVQPKPGTSMPGPAAADSVAGY